jgi:hypothetical protein
MLSALRFPLYTGMCFFAITPAFALVRLCVTYPAFAFFSGRYGVGKVLCFVCLTL